MENFNVTDISVFEHLLREKIYELQLNLDTIKQAQSDFIQTQQSLCDTELRFENEHRLAQELQLQLTTATSLINHMEQEKLNSQIQRAKQEINYANALKERESLIEQAHVVKTQNFELRRKIASLEEDNVKKHVMNEQLKNSLLELKNNMNKIHETINTNFNKLEKEVYKLQEICEQTININNRLKTVGLCTQAINEKYKNEIKMLRRAITLPTQNVTSSEMHNMVQNTEIKNFCVQLETTLMQLKSKIKDGSLPLEEYDINSNDFKFVY